MTTAHAATNVLVHPGLPFSEYDLFQLKPMRQKSIWKKFGWSDIHCGFHFGWRGEHLVSIGRVLSAMNVRVGQDNFFIDVCTNFTDLVTLSNEPDKMVKFLVQGVLH